MASFKLLDLPPELRIAVYHYVLPPKGCYYARGFDERDYSPSDYENLRITCHQVKNEIEQEVMSDIPASIAAVTQLGPMLIQVLRDTQPMHTWTLIRSPSTYVQSRKLEITIVVPYDAFDLLIPIALTNLDHRPTHMRTLRVRLQFDEKETTTEVCKSISKAWQVLACIAGSRQRALPPDQLRLELIWHHNVNGLWTDKNLIYPRYEFAQLEGWSYTTQAVPGGDEEKRLVWSWPVPSEGPPLFHRTGQPLLHPFCGGI